MFGNLRIGSMLAASYLMMCSCQLTANAQPGFGNEGFGAWGAGAASHDQGYHGMNQQQWGGGKPEHQQNMWGSQEGGEGQFMHGAGVGGAFGAGMPGGGPIPTLQGPPQAMFQQVQSMFQQRLAAGQCIDNPMFGDQCEMYAGMGYCSPAYSHANSHNPQVQQQLQWIYENCPESCGLCIETEV